MKAALKKDQRLLRALQSSIGLRAPIMGSVGIILTSLTRLHAKRKHPKAEKNYQYIDVPSEILPRDLEKHFRFVRIDWSSLESYVERRFGQQSDTILLRARRKARVSLSAVSRFLRKTGVNNVHRFLTPMNINKSIDKALPTWSLNFRNQWNRIH